MSLEHFLGLSHEMKIIDLLLSTMDITGKTNTKYTVEELSDFTDIDEPTIKYFLPRLEYNGIIEIEGEQIKLAKNDITMSLLKAVYANSFRASEYPEGVDENNFKKV